ncbi:hypothetical protein WDW89_23275 [Deltaproteobacteria bacterium TL4]
MLNNNCIGIMCWHVFDFCFKMIRTIRKKRSQSISSNSTVFGLLVITFSLMFYTSFVSYSIASEESNAIVDTLKLKVHTALQCASKFGAVSDVQITDMEKQDDGLYVIRGQYAMRGLWGIAPGTFKAKANDKLKLTWMR